MNPLLLLGDEAIAQASIDAGVSGVYAYPGTPSTEITEYVQRNPKAIEADIHREWSANEKTAMEEGLGMSYAGKRTMVCMKHVGLNVAADAFINAAITGINGGLLVVVADDPSMHSSQNEQDTRFYGKFAMIPILEPGDQQEAYDMTYEGFELSEQTGLPVLIRITTRLAHARAAVYQKEQLPEKNLALPLTKNKFILLPALARKKYKGLLETQHDLLTLSESSAHNKIFNGDVKSELGIICSGLTYFYLREVTDDNIPTLRIGQYPLPIELMKEFIKSYKAILVLEDGYPFIEELLANPFAQHKKEIIGRLTGHLPRTGELNPNLVAKALDRPIGLSHEVPLMLANRPPSMCAGCGHIEMYDELNQIINELGGGGVFSDIGCYTLGALPPYNAINSCVDMGASITMAKGAADAGLRPSVAVIGDSTFTHSGMTGLLDAVNENSPITIIISDNSYVAMTGGQVSSAHGKLKEICLGLGVDPEHLHAFEITKKKRDWMIDLLEKEINYEGLSVIIPHRDCIQAHKRNVKKLQLEKEVS